MFERAETYMKKSKDERQAHLCLDESCIKIGGGSKDFRGLLAHFLKTQIMTRKDRANLCHACHNDKCSNPRHLYWGTYAENRCDALRLSGRLRPPKKVISKEEHAAKISLSLKRKLRDDPIFLAAAQKRMIDAAKHRKYLQTPM